MASKNKRKPPDRMVSGGVNWPCVRLSGLRPGWATTGRSAAWRAPVRRLPTVRRSPMWRSAVMWWSPVWRLNHDDRGVNISRPSYALQIVCRNPPTHAAGSNAAPVSPAIADIHFIPGRECSDAGITGSRAAAHIDRTRCIGRSGLRQTRQEKYAGQHNASGNPLAYIHWKSCEDWK